MGEKRSTFAMLDKIEHRLRATANLLGVSENTLKNILEESGIEVRRSNMLNPAAPSIRIFDIPTIFQIAAWRSQQKNKTSPGEMPTIISVEINKGGVAKSTTAAEVAVQLQLSGRKVLVIDVDSQANLTQLMGYEADLIDEEADENELTQEAIITGTFADICGPFLLDDRKKKSKEFSQNIIKHPFGIHGPALIPADAYLSDLEQSIVSCKGRDLAFKRFFEASAAGQVPGLNITDYDIVLLDCPPSISFISTNAITAADIIIAPVKMDSFSVKGLSKLITEITGLSKCYKTENLNPELIILPTFYSTSIPRVGRMNERLQKYKANNSPCSIRQSEEFPKASELYMPLTLLKPTCEPVKEYRLFTEHLLSKIAAVQTRKKAK